LTIITTECDVTDRQTVPNMLTEVNPCFAYMLSKVRKQFRKKNRTKLDIYEMYLTSILQSINSLYIVYI